MIIDSIFPDLFDSSDGKSHILRDKEFIGLDIANFAIFQNKGDKTVHMENVRFKDCSILDNSVSIGGQVSAHNVELINLKCKEYHFDGLNKLDNVRISGGANSIVWVERPIDIKLPGFPYIKGVKLTHPFREKGMSLDLSNFLGELVVYHASPENIRLNPQYHFVVDAKKIDLDDEKLKSEEAAWELLRSLKWYADESESGYFITSLLKNKGKVDPNEEQAVKKLRELGIVE